MITDDYLVTLVHGGLLLGCGGGGTVSMGLTAGRKAMTEGPPRIVSAAGLPGDAVIACVSAVGTVGPGGVERLGDACLRAAELFEESYAGPLAGFVASEVGPGAVTYGWREAAATGKVVVDAPCNGRAHPTGVMGSLGLHRDVGYNTTVAAVGGSRADGTYLELVIRTTVAEAARQVREAAVRAGGAVAVVRNPVSMSYLRQHAAVGALERAHHAGYTLLRARSGGAGAVMEALTAELGAVQLGAGEVEVVALADKGGYTIGRITVRTNDGKQVSIPVCNEYMMVLVDSVPVSRFPEAIFILDAETWLPLPSGSVRPEQQVAVMSIPTDRLLLSSTMADRSLLEPVEELLGINIAITPGTSE